MKSIQPLPAEEQSALRELLRFSATPPQVRRSAQILLGLSRPNASVRSVAKEQFLSHTTINSTVKVYKSGGKGGGIEAIKNWRPKRGRLPCPSTTLQAVIELATSEPQLTQKQIASRTGVSVGKVCEILKTKRRRKASN